MDRASCTAAEVPSTAAAATSGPRPAARPQSMEMTTIPVQITVIVKAGTPSCPIHMAVTGKSCMLAIQKFTKKSSSSPLFHKNSTFFIPFYLIETVDIAFFYR
jgi:hypothetical protein